MSATGNVLVPTEDVLRSSYIITESGCWEWTRSINSGGYGVLWRGTRNCVMAHRASYELHVGPIPEGKVLDHLCRYRACINPDHLEPVSNRTNVLRGIGTSATNARKSQCVNGHAFDAKNTYADSRGWRQCRACKRERQARYDAAKREKAEGWVS